jgi:phage terminase Nu1 subunit (DNA packaging protein)
MSLPRTVSATDLAALLGINDRTLRRLCTRSVLRRNARGSFHLADTVRTYIAHREAAVAAEHGRGAYATARAQLTAEKAQMAKLQRQVLENSLAPLDEVRSVWSAITIVFRTRMLGIGPKVAARLVGLRSAAEIEAIISQEVREALVELSQAEIRRQGDQTDDEAA